MIARHKQIEKQIPLKTILATRYPYTVHPYQTNKSLPWRDNLLIIHRNILDGILLDSLEPTQIESIKEVIKGDPEYRELWKHWFSVKTFLYKYLEKTNQNIMTQ